MSVSKRRTLLIGVVLVILIPVVGWMSLVSMGVLPEPGKPMFPPFNLSDRLSKLQVEHGEDGRVRVAFGNGEHRQVYEAEEFLREVQSRQNNTHGWALMFSVFDITSWVSLSWVVFGLAGQAIFAGRMVVQWLAAEKARAAVVPPVFWWMSLIGSTMLIIYFTWRVEIVGILGQATGWFIYIRNLWFIYGPMPRSMS